jgi:hypothetical protein
MGSARRNAHVAVRGLVVLVPLFAGVVSTVGLSIFSL